ncbi:MAG: thioesterase family protein [Acidimicrobiia bacterium]
MTLYDETLDALREVEHRIPFNRTLGVEMTRFDADGVAMTLPMRDDLVGNWTRGNLHGGVISATLDLVGGMVAIHAAVARGYLDSVERIREAFTSMGTIDLRIDYLRPALGEHFLATGHALRVGRSVTVTRMELRDPDDVLCSVGTGAYRVDAG